MTTGCLEEDLTPAHQARGGLEDLERTPTPTGLEHSCQCLTLAPIDFLALIYKLNIRKFAWRTGLKLKLVGV